MSRNEQHAKAHKKQQRINKQLKRRLYGKIYISPCVYCKNIFIIDELTIEHIIPLSLGGSNDDDNITLACAPCNQRRGRETWMLKKQMFKEQYAQYTTKHIEQNRQEFIQN